MKRSMIAAFSVAVLLASVAQATTIVYQTGFEQPTYSTTAGTPSGALGGQDEWQVQWSQGGVDKFTVQNTTYYEGSQAVKARTNSSVRDIRYLDSVLSVGSTDILVLSYQQYLPAAWFTGFSQGSRALTVTLRPNYTDPEWNEPYNSIILSTWKEPTMQRIGFRAGESELAVAFDQSLLADKWSNLSIVVNNGTGSAEAFLNNTSLGTVTFPVGAMTSIESIEIGASSPSYVDAYVDNLSFSIVPEPGSLVLLGTAALGLLVYASRRRRS
jgi:hypothetical protein